MRLGALFLIVGGLISAVIGIVALRSDPPDDPVRVDVGTPVPLPTPGLFGGQAIIYGQDDADGATRAELGCRMITDTGEEGNSAALSHLAALGEDRRVINGQGMVPLLVVRSYADGWAIECDGAAARAAEPMYLLKGTPLVDMVPMAAFSFTALALVLGVAGSIVLRPRSGVSRW
jgi:hypothetical protein